MYFSTNHSFFYKLVLLLLDHVTHLGNKEFFFHQVHTLYKYLTHKSFLNELVEDFSDLFDFQQDMANNIILRNYLLWIVGEKVYYLKNKETNSTPSDPIKIPHELRFNDYILNIWEKQLPEIYAENYTKRKSNVGKDILEKVVFS